MNVKIENKQIVIRIPIDVMPEALAQSDYIEDLTDTSNGLIPVVVDAEAFAHDVVYRLNDEGPTGETPVTVMLDRVIEDMFRFGEPDGIEMRQHREDGE